MIERAPDSHKGQNGKVMVIGGSELFHGAPILCALGAEYAGVDLVFPWLPPCHAQVARTYSLNFILQTFKETHLGPADLHALLKFSEQVDAVVVGPGLGSHKDTQKTVKTLLSKLKTPTVVDASALVFTNSLPSVTVLTPHRGEFTKLTNEEATPENVQKWAKTLGAVIVCKGPQDIISDGKNTAFNDTGTPLMTVGGTGDVLSGLIGGFMAQKWPAFEAAKTATRLWGRIGETYSKAHGSLRALDLLRLLPEHLAKG